MQMFMQLDLKKVQILVIVTQLKKDQLPICTWYRWHLPRFDWLQLRLAGVRAAACCCDQHSRLGSVLGR